MIGPGKSVQKNFYLNHHLYFYAIIVEEYGLIGGLGVLTLIYFNVLICSCFSQSHPYLAKISHRIRFSNDISSDDNMYVIVTSYWADLSLISSGGTSIWMTCIALGTL
jgi:cell division protein FtsW